VISFCIGYHINIDEPFSLEDVLTICLVLATLGATLIAFFFSRESLNEIIREKSANVLLWTGIDEDSGFITLFVENVGGRAATNLEFSIEGNSHINDICQNSFFNRRHENFPPKSHYKLVVSLFDSADEEIPEDRSTPFKVKATYLDSRTGDKSHCSVEVNPKDYKGVQVIRGRK
jgi:hypothetical protein